MATPADLARLSRYVLHQRMELYPSRYAAAKRAGISKDTWHRVEKAEPVRDMNYAKIDAALKWAAGSCIAVLEGREPVPVEPSAVAPGTVIAAIPSERREGEVRESVERSFLAVADDMTAAQIRELSDRVVEDLKKRGLI